MNNSFLVRLSISQWTARKLDKAATKTAKATAGAAEKAAVKVYKTVLAADALTAIEVIANCARVDHKKLTVPWSYDGPGAITAEGYPHYKATMAKHERDFHAAVALFNQVYDSEREQAKTYLGNMFNAGDYPALATIGSKFAFSVHAEPMPDANNFRPVGLADELVAEVKKDIIANNENALQNANGVAWSRVLETTEKLKLRLQEYTSGQVTKFYDSWLENVIELATTIPSINVANDPALVRIGQKLTALSAYSSADLKVDSNLRADCIKQIGTILTTIGESYRKAA